MKLYSILFESVDESTILRELEISVIKGRDKWNETSKFIDERGTISNFYEMNQSIFAKVTSGADKFKYLGAGAFGLAYDLGNMILKIEEYADRNETIDNELFGKQSTKGLYFPMVYARGNFSGEYANLTYTMLEKFETVESGPRSPISKLVNTISDIISGLYSSAPPAERGSTIDQAKIKLGQDFLDNLASELRLGNNWLEKLVDDMENISKKHKITDFHSGNIGIRRVGGEGYFVFFD